MNSGFRKVARKQSVPEKRSLMTANRIDEPRLSILSLQNQFRAIKILDNGCKVVRSAGTSYFPEDRGFLVSRSEVP